MLSKIIAVTIFVIICTYLYLLYKEITKSLSKKKTTRKVKKKTEANNGQSDINVG